jgi:2-polyprenyl-6-methoxyphenol hydroxylase-like FAD-dependent oxidoreductase
VKGARTQVAVIGAGISGLTFAAAMARYGRECRVFEQAGLFGPVGAGIQLAPNAVRVLHRLGLEGYLASVAVRPRAIEMRRWDDNSLIGRTDLTECPARFGAPYYTVHRANLHEGLLESVPRGTLHLARRLTRFDERDGEVQLQFDEDWSVAARLLVAADGVHSVVRGTLAEDKPRFSGETIYRGLVPAGRVPSLAGEPRVIIWLGPGQHSVCYPVSGGELVSFGATTPAGDWRAESWSAEGRVSDVLTAYEGWNDELRALLAAADTVSRWALYDRDLITQWSTRRVTLLGDAAHPMLPFLAQGANQAIEDADVLATLMRDAPDDLQPVLWGYEEIRRARTDLVHQRSRANTAMMHLADGPEQRRRDRELAARSALHYQDWLYGYDTEKEATDLNRMLGTSR